MKYLFLVVFLFGCSDNELENNVEKEALKIAFIGNSLTFHAKSEGIGWACDCGMAATSIDNDFVHKVSNHFNSSMYLSNISDWERSVGVVSIDLIFPIVLYNPDYIVLNIGENIDETKFSRGEIKQHISYLYNMLKSNTDAEIIILNSFWRYAVVNGAFNDFQNENNVNLIRIDDLGYDYFMAVNEYENRGVAIHPNDLGHNEIAKRVIEAIEEYQQQH